MQCQFGFPRMCTPTLTFNSLEESVQSRTKGKQVLKLYNLERHGEESHINDYIPCVLLAWGANVDAQYIGEESLVLNRYITSYVTKHKSNAIEELWDSINKEKTLASQLKSFTLKSFKN